MALQDLLELSQKHKKIGLSEERVWAIIPQARQYISFWREYPDLFVDFLATGNTENNSEGKFHFYFYQRVFMRAAIRHQYVYAVFPRAYSKSFLAMMILMIRCILYPGSKLFITSGGKEQAAQIVQEKVQEICTLIPAFKREINWSRGVTLEGKDYVKYVFKNGSFMDNIAAKESSRGKRRHSGLIEECVGVDGEILSSVIIPTMNVSRKVGSASDPNESLNKSQVYVTTAGYKGTFAYEKLVNLLVRSIVEPDRAIILGGTWRIPVLMGLQSKTFIKDQKEDGTFNEASFEREYESRWSGTVEDAFFNAETFDRSRVLKQPEYESSGRNTKNQFYIVAADIGRKGCDSVAIVFKVTPQPQGTSIKSVVNIYTMEDTHFEEQAKWLKGLYYKYEARRLVIDGNGLGIGLMDYMVKPQIDVETGDVLYYDFGVYGGTQDDAVQEYKKYKTPNCEQDAIYIIKANAPINSTAHSNAQSQLSSGKVRLLIDEKIARQKLLGTKVGQNMTPEERANYLYPFTQTSILKEEMLNLREENEGINIILKKANKTIRSDKFSAFEYGLYYIKEEEDGKKRKKKFRASDFMFKN